MVYECCSCHALFTLKCHAQTGNYQKNVLADGTIIFNLRIHTRYNVFQDNMNTTGLVKKKKNIKYE